MNDLDQVTDEVKEDISKIPAKSGPAGLLIVMYIVAAIVGLIVLGLLFWLV